MYGLVNQAIEELIILRNGQSAWDRVKTKAQVPVENFVRLESYPDELTYRIVEATCEVCEVSVDQLLEEVGMHWVNFTGANGYGELLDAAGSSLLEILENLDDMHSRISLAYPALQPPSFHCEQPTDDTIVLHYYSQREALAPMVVGLLKGLGARVGANVAVERLQKREEGADHDTFKITLL